MRRLMYAARPRAFARPIRLSGDTMTTPEQPPVQDAAADSAADTEKKAVIAPFSFPFKPSEFAQAKKEPAWHQKTNKHGHHKTPGVAPAGTRRSMGKR